MSTAATANSWIANRSRCVFECYCAVRAGEVYGTISQVRRFASRSAAMLEYPRFEKRASRAFGSMKCPYCREGDFAVVDSRRQEDGGFPIRRRRVCSHCKRKVWTTELIEETPLNVVKKNDERREPFDPAKLRRGLERACYKRPITAEEIDHIARRIQDEVIACYYGEVPSSVIGDLAMEYLRRLDKVAYIRFASVYREFKDVSDFVQEVEPMLKRGKNGPGRRRPRSQDDGKKPNETKR